MVYGIVTDVAAPAEVYDALHAEVGRTGAVAVGLLVHIGRATAGGFQVIEVWESREDYQRYTEEVVLPVMAAMSPGGDVPSAPPAMEEFDVRGLVLAGGEIPV
jgi:hypothetical protein